jgi:hypothetical protein
MPAGCEGISDGWETESGHRQRRQDLRPWHQAGTETQEQQEAQQEVIRVLIKILVQAVTETIVIVLLRWLDPRM